MPVVRISCLWLIDGSSWLFINLFQADISPFSTLHLNQNSQQGRVITPPSITMLIYIISILFRQSMLEQFVNFLSTFFLCHHLLLASVFFFKVFL